MSRTLSLTALLFSLVCITTGQTIGTPEWRSKNNRGNRYEGFGTKPVSNRFELLSFVGSLEPFAANSTLKVRFFLPEALPATVVAKEREPDKLYFMESKRDSVQWKAPGWNEFAPWPVAEVLRSAVPPSKLSVVVYLDEIPCSSCRVAPAWVYHTAPPKEVGAYKVSLRPNATMEKVEWHLYRILPEKELEIVKDTLTSKQGGVPFDIPLNAAGLPEGPLRLYVRGFIAEDLKAKPTVEVTFWHQRIGAQYAK